MDFACESNQFHQDSNDICIEPLHAYSFFIKLTKMKSKLSLKTQMNMEQKSLLHSLSAVSLGMRLDKY